jgi:hypothetical protein
LRLLEISALKMREAEQKQRVEVPGLNPQQFAIEPARFRQVSLLMKLKSRLEQLLAHRGAMPATSSMEIEAGGWPP